jgi:hypothetical protein
MSIISEHLHMICINCVDYACVQKISFFNITLCQNSDDRDLKINLSHFTKKINQMLIYYVVEMIFIVM